MTRIQLVHFYLFVGVYFVLRMERVLHYTKIQHKMMILPRRACKPKVLKGKFKIREHHNKSLLIKIYQN